MPLSTLPSGYKNTSDPKAFRSTDLSDLDADGSTAISLCAPTNPNSELGTALAEIHREGIPSLPGISTWKRRTEVAKAAGSEYLNTVFGWLPLVSDVKNVGSSVRHSRDILSQYHRDEGRNVRRVFEFPPETSESQTGQFGMAPSTIVNGTTGFPEPFQSVFLAPGVVTQTLRIESRKWFVGSFTYATPSQSDSWKRMLGYGSDADKLFGISLTPDVLWELTPWSWAIDWFSNTGDVINNITNFALQGLVMRYGYIMEEKTTTIRHDLRPEPKSGSQYGEDIPASELIICSKVRSPANPFGFGISWEGLSPTQLAITAALGITRLR
jgi:hypothetical protein